MSILPQASIAVWTSLSGAPDWVRSPAKTVVSPAMASAVSWATSPSRSLMRTFAPCSASTSAVALPIPRALPVTIATLSSRTPMRVSCHLPGGRHASYWLTGQSRPPAPAGDGARGRDCQAQRRGAGDPGPGVCPASAEACTADGRGLCRGLEGLGHLGRRRRGGQAPEAARRLRLQAVDGPEHRVGDYRLEPVPLRNVVLVDGTDPVLRGHPPAREVADLTLAWLAHLRRDRVE